MLLNETEVMDGRENVWRVRVLYVDHGDHSHMFQIGL